MKLKYFVSGLLIGSISATTLTTYAIQKGKIEAWLSDHITIYVGNENVKLPETYHILNYQGRIYTPARLIVDKLGGSVDWEDEIQTMYIYKPLPEIVEIESKEPVEVVEEEPSAPRKTYTDAPIKIKMDELTINVFGITEGNDITSIWVDVINQSGWAAFVDFKNAYIEVDGEIYKSRHDISIWNNSLLGDEKRENTTMQFDAIPKREKRMTIYIPVKMTMLGSGGWEEKVNEFKYDIKF